MTVLDWVFGENVNEFHVWLIALATILLWEKRIDSMTWGVVTLALAGIKQFGFNGRSLDMGNNEPEK